MVDSRTHKTKKLVFLSLGIFFLVLAYIGIVLPGFPAIPFILLSLFLFANSSDKLYNWMLRRKVIGKIISKTNARKKNLWFNVFVISQLWVSISVAIIFFIDSFVWSIILIVVGVVFSYATYRLLAWLQEYR